MMRKGKGQGYTLVEMLVTMLIFSVVMTLISVSFARIVKNSSLLNKGAETDIAGLIGLEVVRSDLELAGFGLPWSVPVEVNYVEARETDRFVTGCPDANASLYNDNPPSAYRVGNNVGFNGSDYLVLKGTPLGTSSVCRSWCYVNYNGITRPSRVTPELDIEKKPRVIVLKEEAHGGGTSRTLVAEKSDESDVRKFSVSLDELGKQFAPSEKANTYLAYGVDNNDLRFPFNRTDYYITRGSDRMSSLCNEGTGILYKAVFNHQAGATKYPLLDCAADMQVVLYLDTNGDGEVDYHSADLIKSDDLRRQLKEIRVYILAQQGKRDAAFLHPVRDSSSAILVGDPEWPECGHVWSAKELAERLGANWRNYHWKVYTIVVQPKNL